MFRCRCINAGVYRGFFHSSQLFISLFIHCRRLPTTTPPLKRPLTDSKLATMRKIPLFVLVKFFHLSFQTPKRTLRRLETCSSRSCAPIHFMGCFLWPKIIVPSGGCIFNLIRLRMHAFILKYQAHYPSNWTCTILTRFNCLLSLSPFL